MEWGRMLPFSTGAFVGYKMGLRYDSLSQQKQRLPLICGGTHKELIGLHAVSPRSLRSQASLA